MNFDSGMRLVLGLGGLAIAGWFAKRITDLAEEANRPVREDWAKEAVLKSDKSRIKAGAKEVLLSHPPAQWANEREHILWLLKKGLLQGTLHNYDLLSIREICEGLQESEDVILVTRIVEGFNQDMKLEKTLKTALQEAEKFSEKLEQDKAARQKEGEKNEVW